MHAVEPRCHHSCPRRAWRALLALPLAVLLGLATPAQAAIPLGDRVDVSMYGRVGVAWTPTGQFIHGRTMNVTGNSIGGRLEEGDYLEPTVVFKLLKPEAADAPYTNIVFTPAMFSANGLFLGVFSNRFASTTLRAEIFQAYVEAGNVLLPGLKIWGGARFYRGNDVHNADYFYFNNLSGQGGGVQYGALDVAVILQTSNSTQYNYDANGDGEPDSRRQRSVFVSQYEHKFGDSGHTLRLLGEFHWLPRGIAQLQDGGRVILRSDWGSVLGAKLHLDLGNGSFNDLSLRYGTRAANGSRAGTQTWDSFGLPNSQGRFEGANGWELVEHFLFNVNPLLSLNGYGILDTGAGSPEALQDGTAINSVVNFAAGVRSTLYLHNQFHLINEVSYQGLVNGNNPMATVWKFSLVPTFVPTGERSIWARPHLRFIYTLGLYNQQAQDTRASPFLQVVGATPVAHYLGVRSEWWF